MKKATVPPSLPPELKKHLLELADRGHRLRKEKRREEAIRVWQEALSLIPEPRQAYPETADFLSAIGEAYLAGGQYTQALECFQQVLANPAYSGLENPFTLRALGEIAWETGDQRQALKYLGKAYALEGEDIFCPDVYGEIDHQKYLLKAHLTAEEKGDTR